MPKAVRQQAPLPEAPVRTPTGEWALPPWVATAPRDAGDPGVPARPLRAGRRLQPRLGRRRAGRDRPLVRRLRRGRRAVRGPAPGARPDRPPAARRLAGADPGRLRLLAALQPADVDPVRREPARDDAGRPGRARRVLPAQQHAAGVAALPGPGARDGRACTGSPACRSSCARCSSWRRRGSRSRARCSCSPAGSAGRPPSARMAVLLYAASNQFYFFNAQFSYQTVAIAMVMAAFYLLVRAFDSPVERPWTLLVTAQVCLGALAITHHLTSWIMLATLWTLALFFWFGGERRRFQLTLLTAEIATAVVAAWTAVIAPLLIDYLTPDLQRGHLPARRPPPGRRRARARVRQRRHPHAHVGGDGHVRLVAAVVPAPRPGRVGRLAPRVDRGHQGPLRPAPDRRVLPRAPARALLRGGQRGGGPGLDVRVHGDGPRRRRLAREPAGRAAAAVRARGRAARARRHDPRQRAGLAAGAGTVPGRRRAALRGRHDGVRRGVGRALPPGRVQRRRRRDVQPGHPELRRRHLGDPAGRLRERDPDVHLRVVRPDLAGADPAQRGRLRGRRHPAGRPDACARARSTRAAPATARPPRRSRRRWWTSSPRSRASTWSSTARSRSTTCARCAGCRRRSRTGPARACPGPGRRGRWA